MSLALMKNGLRGPGMKLGSNKIVLKNLIKIRLRCSGGA